MQAIVTMGRIIFYLGFDIFLISMFSMLDWQLKFREDVERYQLLIIRSQTILVERVWNHPTGLKAVVATLFACVLEDR